MKMLKKYAASLLAFFWLLLSIPAFAQNLAEIEMADQLRADGKIYVVVAVLTVILAGILVFLFMLDRKLSRLEKELKA
ncbi:CcmD family protein [Adhaeribacter sp. BT258]|uniref:CcmD family protein n=1 Tax=Adhaeribacter terrigena TaxID=2793070 RepID=A0ABS1C533_9BACT|nr:CcmD family protein [Adhaeribacter terrigena]MBK0404502.1 CcmD family protein [Adhaeribacter terrigena]